jgi:hypothetical protein
MRKYLILGLLLIPLILYAFATLYVRYWADDFCLAASAHKLGILGSAVLLYQETNGRFAYHIAVSVIAFIPFIGLSSLITLLLWSAAVWDIGRQVKIRSELALAVLVAMFSATPNLTQVLYWQSALFVYGFALALFCVLIALMLRKASPVVCAILAFLISGFSDTVSVAQIAIFGLFILWSLSSKTAPVKPMRRQILFSLIGACVGFLLVYIAPGTAARRAVMPAPDLGQSLILAARAWILPFVVLIRQKPGILIAMLVIPWGLATYETRLIRRKQLKLWLLFSFMGLFVVNYLCFLLGYYATSRLLVERAQSVPMFFTLVEIAFASYVVGCIVRRSIPKGVTIGFLLLLICLSSAYAIEFVGKLQRYAQLADEREKQIRAGITQVAAIDSDYVPGGDLGDLQTAPDNYWINGCMAHYYGVEKIKREAR